MSVLAFSRRSVSCAKNGERKNRGEAGREKAKEHAYPIFFRSLRFRAASQPTERLEEAGYIFSF